MQHVVNPQRERAADAGHRFERGRAFRIAAQAFELTPASGDEPLRDRLRDARADFGYRGQRLDAARVEQRARTAIERIDRVGRRTIRGDAVRIGPLIGEPQRRLAQASRDLPVFVVRRVAARRHRE